MYEVSEGKIEVKADYEVIECFILSGSPFDDRHLLGWKRLISFQD